LWHLGVLTVLDVNLFGAYCQSVARWRLAEEALARMVDCDPVMNGLLVKASTGDARLNPLVRAARDAANDIVMFAGQFGIGAAARARISAGIGHEPPSKFGDLLA
jgi:phage terminase small subunit